MKLFKMHLYKKQLNSNPDCWVYSSSQPVQVNIQGSTFSVTSFTPGSTQSKSKSAIKTIWLDGVTDEEAALYQDSIGSVAYYIEDSVVPSNSKLISEEEFLALEDSDRAMLQA